MAVVRYGNTMIVPVVGASNQPMKRLVGGTRGGRGMVQCLSSSSVGGCCFQRLQISISQSSASDAVESA